MRAFRLLLAGSAVSSFGSWLLVVAVPYQVFRLTGSTLATGLTLAVESLPAVLVGPWAGVLVDRWDRRTTMVVADLTSAAGVALILLDRLPLIYLGLLVESLAVVFFRPAARAILPALVGTGPALAVANGRTALAGGVTRLVAPPTGTLLLTAAGLPVVVVIDMASYLISAVLALRLPASRRPSPPGATRLRAGIRHIATTPVLRGLLISSAAFLTANAALTALLIPFVVRRLDRSGADLGYLIAGLGLGYVVGSAASHLIVARFGTRTVIAFSQLGVGLCFLALFNARTLPVAVVAAALTGVPGSIMLVATQHRLQLSTPDAVLGRVGAVFYASDALAAVAGAVIGPGIAAAAGLSGGLNILSATVLVVAAASAALTPRG
jgi:MFS family permease